MDPQDWIHSYQEQQQRHYYEQGFTLNLPCQSLLDCDAYTARIWYPQNLSSKWEFMNNRRTTFLKTTSITVYYEKLLRIHLKIACRPGHCSL